MCPTNVDWSLRLLLFSIQLLRWTQTACGWDIMTMPWSCATVPQRGHAVRKLGLLSRYLSLDVAMSCLAAHDRSQTLIAVEILTPLRYVYLGFGRNPTNVRQHWEIFANSPFIWPAQNHRYWNRTFAFFAWYGIPFGALQQ